jgi:hypothetical protein
VSISRSLKRAVGRSGRTNPTTEAIEDLRDELTERATLHEILAAQRTDLVVDQLWRRLEAADARLATALQRLEDRVSALEQQATAIAPPPRQDEPLLLNE